MRNRNHKDLTRLDAGESLFFQREMESVDEQTYNVEYPDLIARQLIPTQPGIPDWARVYTWREYDKVGAAKIIGNMADDLPRADAKGIESSKIIKPIGDSYGYDVMEIKEAAAMNRPLDAMRADAARFAMESQIDDVLALGSSPHNLEGILNLASVSLFVLGTKAAGGVSWGTIAAPNATGLEAAMDVMAFLSDIVEATASRYSRFRVVLPIAAYNFLVWAKIGVGTDTTAMQYLKANCEFLADIRPWYKCKTAGAGSTTRMAAFPVDAKVVAGIVPMEFSPQAAIQKNLEWVINCLASCGGVVCRYPIAMRYADGL